MTDFSWHESLLWSLYSYLRNSTLLAVISESKYPNVQPRNNADIKMW